MTMRVRECLGSSFIISLGLTSIRRSIDQRDYCPSWVLDLFPRHVRIGEGHPSKMFSSPDRSYYPAAKRMNTLCTSKQAPPSRRRPR